MKLAVAGDHRRDISRLDRRGEGRMMRRHRPGGDAIHQRQRIEEGPSPAKSIGVAMVVRLVRVASNPSAASRRGPSGSGCLGRGVRPFILILCTPFHRPPLRRIHAPNLQEDHANQDQRLLRVNRTFREGPTVASEWLTTCCSAEAAAEFVRRGTTPGHPVPPPIPPTDPSSDDAEHTWAEEGRHETAVDDPGDLAPTGQALNGLCCRDISEPCRRREHACHGQYVRALPSQNADQHRSARINPTFMFKVVQRKNNELEN